MPIYDLYQITDRQAQTALLGRRTGIANAAGSGAGASVSVNVSFVDQWGSGLLPASLAYTVMISPSQACVWNVTAKTASGFTVVLTPLSSSTTLAAGTFDLAVVA